MNTFYNIMLGVVIFTHFYICYFEMFQWQKKGPKIFTRIPKELFSRTEAMAANQGLYNLFLAVGLLWTVFIVDPVWSTNIAIFFLSCVVAAGVYGSQTIEKKIFFTQALPAIIALGALFAI